MAAQQLGQKMTNQDVIDMVGMGLSDELIIEKIRTSDTTAFDTSVPALRVLKAAKVSDSLIRAMVNPHPAATVGTAPANPMETVESLESRLAQTPECANATDSIKCRDKVASLLQGNVKNYPSMRITAVDHVLLYTDPLALSKREARDSLHNFAQNAGQSFLCKYKFTTIRVEADRVTGEEYDLGCPKAPVSAPIPNDPGTSTAPELAVPKAQEPAATASQGELSKADKKKESKPAKARKAFAEEVRQKTIKDWANNPVPGFNLTAEGPDSTFYVVRLPEIPYDQCKSLVLENLRAHGFTRVVCIADQNTTFTFDLAQEDKEQSQDFFVSYSTILSTLHPGTCIGKYCTYDYNTYECQMRCTQATESMWYQEPLSTVARLELPLQVASTEEHSQCSIRIRRVRLQPTSGEYRKLRTDEGFPAPTRAFEFLRDISRRSWDDLLRGAVT
jgi:hypothetical protein